MLVEPHRTGGARQGFTAHEMSVPPRQVAFGLMLEALPYEVRDNKAEHPVAKEFEAFVAAM
jgi:hypothetical protein